MGASGCDAESDVSDACELFCFAVVRCKEWGEEVGVEGVGGGEDVVVVVVVGAVPVFFEQFALGAFLRGEEGRVEVLKEAESVLCGVRLH